MRKSYSEIISTYGILTVSILFVAAVKIPHLGLPYSWDEAWSYIPAIQQMADQGPTLLPSKTDIYLTKGHPLLFYFLISGWISLFSETILVVRILPFFLSLLLLISVHYLFRKNISLPVANTAVLLTVVQSLFLAQASLVLPEILLTLLLILSLHFFLQKKWVMYAIMASLMALTKETGLVFAWGFGLFYLLENRNRILHRKTGIIVAVLFVPAMVYVIHLMLHYISHGTFFFGEHLDYLSLDLEKLLRVLRSSTAILFTLYGRNVISGIVIIALILMIFRRKKIEHMRLISLLFLMTFLLILFSMVNFYTYRYILPAFPLFAGIAAIITGQAFGNTRKWFVPLIILMISVPLYFSVTKKGRYDIDFGYAEFLPVHLEMVHFCEKQGWYDRKIAAGFNMVVALRDPGIGYLTQKRGFQVLHLPDIGDAELVILDSTDDMTTLPEEYRQRYTLVRRFTKGKHWGEIYAVDSEYRF